MYGFIERWKYSQVRKEGDVSGSDTEDSDGLNNVLSDKTICKWWEIFRTIVGEYVLEHQTNEKIGGVGFIIEIGYCVS